MDFQRDLKIRIGVNGGSLEYKNVNINLEEKKEKKYYGYRKNKRKNFRER